MVLLSMDDLEILDKVKKKLKITSTSEVFRTFLREAI